MDASDKKNLFGGVTELEDGRVKVGFTTGDAIFTKEQYLLYRQKIEKANKFYKERAEKERTTPCQDKRHLQILYTFYNREFESIAKGVVGNVPYFKEIIITDGAYKKANWIAKRMHSLAGDNEIYLHLINSIKQRKKMDFVVRDVYIPGGQIVTPVTCSLKYPSEKMKDSQKIMERGWYISGWAHSHARMQTFHSGTDKNNLLTEVLNGTTVKISPNPFGIGKVQEYSFRFFPSIVFNALGDLPSCAIAIDYPQFVLGKGLTMKTHINFSPRLRIRKEANQVHLNSQFINEEIKTKVLSYNKGLAIYSPEKIVESEPNLEKTESKPNLEKKVSKSSPAKKIDSFRIFKRLGVLEKQYEELYGKLIRLEKQNIYLKKKVENLEGILEREE